MHLRWLSAHHPKEAVLMAGEDTRQTPEGHAACECGCCGPAVTSREGPGPEANAEVTCRCDCGCATGDGCTCGCSDAGCDCGCTEAAA